MNKTKKLTQGAMMLAIVGALILIDRITAYWFTELVVLIMPVVIIMYSAIHTLKDGLFLSIGLIIIAFLLGNFQTTYLIYVPVGIIVGLAYSYGVSKNMDKRSLMMIAIITYVLGELVTMLVIYPLIGFPISTMIAEYKLALDESAKMTGYNFDAIFASLGNTNNVLVVIYIVSTIMMGAMEGILIHILALFLLKRFKIKDLGKMNLWDIKPNPVLGYVCFGSFFFFYLRNFITNDTVFYILLCFAIIGSFILLYYGYIFLVLYGALILRRNIGMIVVILALFVPIVAISMIIMGFLYSTGPLRNYLENKVNLMNNIKNE